MGSVGNVKSSVKYLSTCLGNCVCERRNSWHSVVFIPHTPSAGNECEGPVDQRLLRVQGMFKKIKSPFIKISYFFTDSLVCISNTTFMPLCMAEILKSPRNENSS